MSSIKVYRKVFSMTLTALIAFSACAKSEVHFQDVTFEDAKALAAKEHKTVMVDFYTTWCVWCKTLDRNTYSDASVGKIADDKFIAVKIDAEKGEGVALAKQYKVNGYPTIVFFNAKGDEVDRVVGYQEPSRFARSLEIASEGGSKAIVADIEGAHPTNDPKKWLIAANYYAQENDRDKSLAAFRKVLALDPNDKQGGNAEAMYGVGFLSQGDEQWKTLSDALAKYPNEADASQANMLLMRHDLDVKDTADAGHRIDAWAMSHPNDGNSFNFFAWNAAEHAVLLASAEEYAKRAVSMANSIPEKAGAMDTHAEVLYRSGKIAQASQEESNALALLDPQKDKKLYAELTSQKQKFDKAIASAGNK